MISDLTKVQAFYLKLAGNNKVPSRTLFDAFVSFYGHMNKSKLELYWKVTELRCQGKSLRVVGDLVGLSAERIRQIEKKLMRAMFYYEQQADRSGA